MWENVNGQRRMQRYSAFCAALILVSLLAMLPIGGSAADWLNATWAPTAEADRYQAVATQSDVTFDMDSDSLKSTGDYASYYVWENASGDVLYSNVTHSSGVVTVTTECTEGNSTGNITNDLSWSTALPYFKLYFDYTALEAYQDNVVRIRVSLSSLNDGGNSKARTITLTAGGVTFYTHTIASDDTQSTLDVNVTVSTTDLRTAIINDGELSYFCLTIKGTDHTGLDFSGSTMYTYASSILTERDDGLYLFVTFAIAAAAIGIPMVQPRNSLPFKKGASKGGW